MFATDQAAKLIVFMEEVEVSPQGKSSLVELSRVELTGTADKFPYIRV